MFLGPGPNHIEVNKKVSISFIGLGFVHLFLQVMLLVWEPQDLASVK